MGWDGLKNGRLLAAAAGEGFDALVTMDRHVAEQQNLTALPMSLVVLRAASNQLEDLRPLISSLLGGLDVLKPQQVVFVGR